jgi:hypothetical protein
MNIYIYSHEILNSVWDTVIGYRKAIFFCIDVQFTSGLCLLQNNNNNKIRKWLVVLGRGLIHLTARHSGSNGHAKLQTQAVDTPPHRNPGSRRPRSGSRAISLNRFCPRLMAQHAPMDGYGQSRALDCDRRGQKRRRWLDIRFHFQILL